MAAPITSEAPPAYEPSSSPPSYDALVDRVAQMVGPDPTPQKYLDAAATLADGEIEILVDGGDFSDPTKNEEDVKTFNAGTAEGLKSPECVEYIRFASDAAVAAARDIDQIFVALHLKIAQIDRIHHSGFEEPLAKLHWAFVNVLGDSRRLANEVAVHGDRFDDLIIPFCLDENMSTDDRRRVLEHFKGEMDQAGRDSVAMEGKWHTLRSDFTSFVAGFSTWANDKVEDLNQEIAQVLEELEELSLKLGRLVAALSAMGPAGGGLAAVGAFMLSFGFLAPFLKIAGLIALGIGASAIVSVAGLAIAKNATERQISVKQREKQSLLDQVEVINQAQEELRAMGRDKLEAFSNNINALRGVWTNVSSDAHTVQRFLDGAISMLELPPWMMERDLEQANSYYKRMAEYLRNYARGISG